MEILVDKKLEIIDPEEPIAIKINKNYIPFIATKCIPDENTYICTGARRDGEER